MAFPYFWPWLSGLAIFDLNIGFLIKNCVCFTPGMHGKTATIRMLHGFSKAGFGHASLSEKRPPLRFLKDVLTPVD